MDRITRKGLKQDKFALEVGHTVEYLGEHRRQAVRIGVAALAVLVIALGIFAYRRYSHNQRQAALSAALTILQAPVSATPNDAVRTFPTEQEKNKAAVKAFNDVANNYSGSDEATIATYYHGVLSADEGKLADAERALKQVADSGNEPYAALGKLVLADLYRGQGKTADAERLLREIIADPSAFVSKEQATLALADLLSGAKPAEARKLLEPLQKERAAVSRYAISAIAELPK